VSKHDDEVMLDAYNEGLELAARLLKALGCDDPKQATQEQIDAVMSAILAPIAAGGVKITERQLKADHRKLTWLKARRVS
jgi:hypothetical protein